MELTRYQLTWLRTDIQEAGIARATKLAEKATGVPMALDAIDFPVKSPLTVKLHFCEFKKAERLYAELEAIVLDRVPDHSSEQVVYASYVAKEIGIPVDVCKAILRQLRDKGLIRLTVAVHMDYGWPCGSGYVKVTPPRES